MTVVNQLLFGTLVLGVCAVIQVFAIVYAVDRLMWLRSLLDVEHHINRRVLVLLAAFAAVVVIHTIQVFIWGAILVYLDALPSTDDAIYFALVTYTTLGYGDVVASEGYRVFAAMAAVTGLLAFGLSTAFLVGLVSRMLSLPFSQN